ncbi:MAG: START domain-containing protein [Leptospiraceae bacterium]|nr:START domain-containing protein [Leptospiraceae bacterium]MCP5493672.1 START domain-containing protein [Leptospiraceae bacterium]
MKKSTLFFIIIYFTLFINKLFSWEKSLEKNDVVVYTRSVSYSSVKEYKAIARVHASLSTVYAVFNDVPNYKNWMHLCKKSKIVKDISLNQKYIYLEIQPKGPTSPRDVVINANITQNPKDKELIIQIQSIKDILPEKNGIIRVPKLKGYYKLKPLKNKEVEITYQQFVDPGGNVPAFLFNTTITSEPYNTLNNLRQETQKAKYQKAKFDFIKE